MSDFKWQDCYISYLNLDSRIDRLIHIEQELIRVGIKAERTRGKLPQEFDLNDPRLQVQVKRTPGSIGCHFGMVEIMQKAVDQNKSAIIFEDDCQFCSDFQERLDYIEMFLNKQKDWTFFFLGGTFHCGPSWWHKPGHSLDLQQCKCELGRDAETTNDPRIMRVYGMFSTHAWIISVKWIERVLEFLDTHLHLSMGIDWITILMQPLVNAYCYVPGCVRQIDNKSDIGYGITMFSGFSKLNGSIENSAYWWQDKAEDFNPSVFDWKEATKS
jgi:GR25 family glycosyltransferase involved in LPS biosynthesis